MLAPPHPALRASVVVPARNEEELVASSLSALAKQEAISPEEYEVLLVLDNCTDATKDRALEAAAKHPDLRLYLLEGPGRGAGHARRVGMEEAYLRFLSLERPDGLIASTDADTVVAPNWLSVQIQAADRGARAIGGRIELRDDTELPRDVSGWHTEQGRLRQRELSASPGPSNGSALVEHWQFSGASLALTAATYAEIGGLEPRAALEDEYLERALLRCGVPIERPLAVRVATSARLTGRANRGLARDLSLASWVRNNTYDASNFDREDILERKRALKTSVSVVVPLRARDHASEALLDSLRLLYKARLIDETIGVCPETEAYSLADRTGDGMKIYRDADLMPDFGPVRGYGDALWRGLSATTGDIVLFLDPSVPDPEGGRIAGLLGPLLFREISSFVKGYASESDDDGEGAGVLSELVARPLINLYHPELAGFMDPLSTELAARRSLLVSLPFPAGHSVSLSLLLDAARVAGVDALTQTRLAPYRKLQVPLADLGEAAYAILTAAAARTYGKEEINDRAPGPLFLPLPGRSESRRVAVEERPPLTSLQRTITSGQEASRGGT